MLNKSHIENLQRVDPDRYRAALFADKQERSDLLTLYAFHAELAKVPEIVSEPMIGNIRYQWWRDAIEEIYGGKPVRAHNIVQPLADVIQRRNLPRFWIDLLIDGRERDLDPTPFVDLPEAKTYCRNTSGTLLLIAAHCLDPNLDTNGLEMAGESWGLVGLARSWKYYHGSVLSNLTFDALIDAARETHGSAQQILGVVRGALMPSLVYCALIPHFVRLMENPDYLPESSVPNFPPFRKKLKLMGAVIKSRI